MTLPLTLYVDAYWISPYAFTAFVGLAEKGLPFEVQAVALQDKAQHEPGYRDRSITGRVPALAHGDFFLAESQAIVEYLDDAFPEAPRLLPSDLRQRARARQILGWVRSDLMALREERSTTTMFYARSDKPLSPAGEKAAEKLLRVAGALIPEGSTSLFGAWSIADADLAFMLQRLLLNGYEAPAKVRAFVDAQWGRPSVQRFAAHERPPFVPYSY